jgi:hypothetical protein
VDDSPFPWFVIHYALIVYIVHVVCTTLTLILIGVDHIDYKTTVEFSFAKLSVYPQREKEDVDVQNRVCNELVNV